MIRLMCNFKDEHLSWVGYVLPWELRLLWLVSMMFQKCEKIDRLLGNEAPPIFKGKIAKFYAKIARNWKISVVCIFQGQMV